jgi:curved DNA-binding protein CbpA
MATQGVEFQDYYKTLGVAKAASQAEIKKAYRRLAREWHPDRKPGDQTAERRFKELNEANAVLSDPGKREKYDRFGRDWEAYARAGAAPGGRGGADPFGAGSPFAAYGFGGTSGSGTGPGGIRYEFRTTGDPGAFSDFFRMMFGDEVRGDGAAPDVRHRGASIADLLAGWARPARSGAGRRRRPQGAPPARPPRRRPPPSSSSRRRSTAPPGSSTSAASASRSRSPGASTPAAGFASAARALTDVTSWS